MILFAQNVAGARNVKPMKRLEALHNDIAALINDEKPTASWELTKTKWNTYQLDITTTPANGSPLIGNSAMIGC